MILTDGIRILIGEGKLDGVVRLRELVCVLFLGERHYFLAFFFLVFCLERPTISWNHCRLFER